VVHFTYKNRGPKITFPFHLRIPAWCKEAVIAVNGEKIQQAKGGQVIKIERTWNNDDEVTLTLPMEVSLEKWNENSVSVQRGPLVYALKIDEQWERVKNDDNYGDFLEVHPLSPWNYGLIEVPQKEWQQAFKVVKNKTVSGTPWNIEHAPIEINVMAVALPQWKLYNGNAGPLPYSPQPMPENGKPVSVTLIPYGCTTLRISEFPVVEK
ncbi:MAG: glycoside hydrolase family 127 protein, partial [Bacteroidota bacterium]|nr:glycoside hydrolase family 127 protein [Bacteroidota bacterium]